MNKILIFNPDTDYALASGSPYYTPPKSVRQLTERMEMFPLTYAEPGDIALPYSEIDNIVDKAGGIKNLTHYKIEPWGWNPLIRRQLIDAGVPDSMLPSAEKINSLRLLSHRRTTIEANRLINYYLKVSGVENRHFSPFPIEFDNVDTLLNLYHATGQQAAFIKAPWSSSGRGILYTPDCTDTQISEWTRGIIRRQGSVMYETAANKAMDFATEWIIEETDARFIGMSMFEASARGKYHRNLSLPQEALLYRIRKNAPDFDDRFIEAQRLMLRKLVVSKYQGPLGIDMLVETSGAIRACIEINMRMTMGHAALMQNHRGLNTHGD